MVDISTTSTPQQLRDTLERLMNDPVLVDLPATWRGRGMTPQQPHILSISSYEWIEPLATVHFIELKVSFKLISPRALESRIKQYLMKYANMNVILMHVGSYEVGGRPAMLLAYETYQ